MAKAVMALLVAWTVWSNIRVQHRQNSRPESQGRYARSIFLPMLPPVMLAFGFLEYGSLGLMEAVKHIFYEYIPLFVIIAVYNTLLLMAIPALRRVVDARTCAGIWLIPNVLYLTVVSGRVLLWQEPLWVWTVPGHWVQGAALVWAGGFVLVLLGGVFSHLVFQHCLLRDAEPVTDEAVLQVWRAECRAAGKPDDASPLLISPYTQTPLAIGLFRAKLVLPKQQYAPDDLALVLRHELIHLERGDIHTKFFLLFCTALCWWNPLLWLARRRCAEDLELSCDEAALVRAQAPERKRYAQLILTTAGQQRGFTTCLSVSAKALRYRLRGIIYPGKRRTGAVLAGGLALVVFLSAGCCTLEWDIGTVEDHFLEGHAEDWTLQTVRVEGETLPDQNGGCWDTDDLMQTLAGLTLIRRAGSDVLPREKTPGKLELVLRSGETVLCLEFWPGQVAGGRLWPLGKERVYHLDDPAALEGLLRFLPE